MMDKRNKSYNDFVNLDKTNKYCVYEFFKKYPLGSFHGDKSIKKYFPQIYADFLKTKFPDNNFTNQQLLYHYFNDDFDFKIGLCKNCGKRCKFRNFIYGYGVYCSNECQRNYVFRSEESILKRKKTLNNKKQKTKQKRKEKEIEKKLISFNFNIEKITDKLYVFEFIKKYPMVFSRRPTVKKFFSSLYNDFITYNFPNNMSFSNQFYHYLLSDYELNIGKCQICGNRTRYISFGKGYCKVCVNCVGEYHKENGTSWDSFSEDKKNEIRNKISEKNKNRPQEIIDKQIEHRMKNHAQKMWDENGLDIIEKKDRMWVIKCHNETCKLRNECDGIYEINYLTYRTRNKHNIELCTKLNVINLHQTSNMEKEMVEFVKSIYGGIIIEHDRTILENKKELDIYLPEINVAIEFNGLYWHCEEQKERKYHQTKSMICRNKNIQLIQIWEDDWLDKNEIVKDIISSKIGNSKKIYARKCEVREIDSKVSKIFLDENHLQGNVNASIKFGLFYKNELVMVSTFGKLRNFMNSHSSNNEYELYRLCSKIGYQVIGGFSKLLKYFEKKYKPTKLITYADFNISNGGVYEKTGFILDSITKPNYFWIKGQKKYNRVQFMKHKISNEQNKHMSETEIMHNMGYLKLYTSGNIKYIKNY